MSKEWVLVDMLACAARSSRLEQFAERCEGSLIFVFAERV